MSRSKAQVAPATSNDARTMLVSSRTAKGGRRYQEDRCVMLPNFNEYLPDKSTGRIDGVKRSYFAVFDGHGGDKCSEYLMRNFHKVLAIQQCLASDPRQAIIDAWETTDQAFLKECRARQKGAEHFPKDGSTASVLLMVDAKMYAVNSGDSPIMILNKHAEVTVISADHGTNNKDECERIINAGARIVFQQGLRPGRFPMCCIAKTGNIGKGRVYPGGLLITRSFGDYNARLPELGGNPNGITNIPFVCELPLDKNVHSILIASDGVTDALRPDKELPTYMACYLDENDDAHKWPDEAGSSGHRGQAFVDYVCKNLIKDSVEHDRWAVSNIGADNATVVYVAFGV